MCTSSSVGSCDIHYIKDGKCSSNKGLLTALSLLAGFNGVVCPIPFISGMGLFCAGANPFNHKARCWQTLSIDNQDDQDSICTAKPSLLNVCYWQHLILAYLVQLCRCPVIFARKRNL